MIPIVQYNLGLELCLNRTVAKHFFFLKSKISIMQFMWEHEDHCTLGKLHNTFEELCYPKVGSSFFLFNCALVYISFYT